MIYEYQGTEPCLSELALIAPLSHSAEAIPRTIETLNGQVKNPFLMGVLDKLESGRRIYLDPNLETSDSDILADATSSTVRVYEGPLTLGLFSHEVLGHQATRLNLPEGAALTEKWWEAMQTDPREPFSPYAKDCLTKGKKTATREDLAEFVREMDEARQNGNRAKIARLASKYPARTALLKEFYEIAISADGTITSSSTNG